MNIELEGIIEGSVESNKTKFFTKIDWAAFWLATTTAFLVYFFTLGPSVGLEDSGELATAADHLGVPHPPGYPFWSLCGWLFCRVFSWVTYMGQPTPAWAMSLFSAVTGALAAGCTAMLICRSGTDMLDSMSSDSDEPESANRGSRTANALMSLAGGVGGSLVFAFSPVEWSQSTIVEIYSLNALFLMAVFLLSYRWMRKPSDKVLWLTAFIFGLGLTNYQVLLLAALPLAIIIALRNIRMFRDFVLIMIPFGLTAKLLQIGSMMRANAMMQADVINKYEPVLRTDSCPNEVFLWLGFALVVLAPVAAMLIRGSRQKTVLSVGGAGVGLVFLAATVFAGDAQWVTEQEIAVAPLLEPTRYAFLGALLAASCVAAFAAALAPEDAPLSDKRVWRWLAVSGGCAFVALCIAGSMRAADAAGYVGEPFAWGKPILMLLAGVVALFALAAWTPRGLAFAIPVAGVQLVAFVLLAKGAMNGLTHPSSWWFAWPCIWNFAMIGLAALALPCGRSIAPAVLFAELGVSFYVYMPIVSDLRNPPMNWGYPRTWEGFKHAIMRGQYEAITMPDFFSKEGFSLFTKQMGFYFQDLRMQFTLVAAALALLPFALWKFSLGRATSDGDASGEGGSGGRSLTVAAVWPAAAIYVVVTALVVVFSELFETLTNGEVPLRLDKYLLAALAILAFVGVVAIVFRQIVVVIGMVRGRPLELDARWWRFPKFQADDVSQQWLIALGACFGIMSMFLVALAGVKGDIQDGFIQKVKFISSHGIFAVWIGYGILVGLVVANRIVSRFVKSASARRVAFAILCAMGALVAAIPVYENYTNDQLVFAMGSAEQNGHTFGWQFGNYQLRGANAIREELLPDEEPLPNPLFPEEMEPSAIFFGGTDPGRFVPTYMIYSADVRPDVYLITQNALADDTYMSVERDLYGDEIWIPSKEDSAESFNIYVSEVQSGKRQANAALKIENGRVQVTGALGVMEINGILTKMMFDHDRLRHAFYVEESYVIPWMYPYLAPHGLIMKIRKDAEPIPQANVVNDMEFWDWYHRRLVKDPGFRRDFPAQKSFSKLRAAIAGLYAKTGHFREAGDAFREATLLYPASPEASFRYIQEVLMPMRRWTQIEDILDFTDRVDPNNSRTAGMRDYVQRLRGITEDVEHLQRKAAAGKISAQESFHLAQCYLSLGQFHMAGRAVRKALEKPEAEKNFQMLCLGAQLLAQANQRGDAAQTAKKAVDAMPGNADPMMHRELSRILMEGGLNVEAEQQLNAYLRVRGRDADAWMQMAILKDAIGDAYGAQNAIRQAYNIDPNAAAERLRSNEQLQRIAAPLFRRRMQ